MFNKFTIKTQETLVEAQNIALKYKHQELLPEHLLLALVGNKDSVCTAILEKIGINPGNISELLVQELQKLPYLDSPSQQLYISSRMKQVFDIASREAENFKDKYISGEHLLIGILEENGSASNIMKKMD